MSDDKKVILTSEQAKAMLPDGPEIHTYLNPCVDVLIGADWSRAHLEEEIDRCVCELAGPMAAANGHSLVVHIKPGGPMFVATKEPTPEPKPERYPRGWHPDDEKRG